MTQCVFLVNTIFIIFCSHHYNQGTEVFHHHKDLSVLFLYSHTHLSLPNVAPLMFFPPL